jgi:hypothetical protein
MRIIRRVSAALTTLKELVGHFAVRERFFLLPLVLIVLLAAILLTLTGGLSYVTPFLYTLF